MSRPLVGVVIGDGVIGAVVGRLIGVGTGGSVSLLDGVGSSLLSLPVGVGSPVLEGVLIGALVGVVIGDGVIGAVVGRLIGVVAGGSVSLFDGVGSSLLSLPVGVGSPLLEGVGSPLVGVLIGDGVIGAVVGRIIGVVAE